MRHLRALARTTPLRLLALLLVLGLLARPVLGSVGEVHELAHEDAAAHAHASAVDGPSHGAGHADDGERGTAGLLHALLHFAHCCGQVPALPSAAPTPALAWTAAVAPRPLDHGGLPSAPVLTPFRPPISA
ncbi:hypothetical protein B1992_13700 [Pseudoxanthomonas broegbernensis]|uniref:Uncharacterized protein n=1 Tax=Pseudoxanthomonas broegbernensis TaxID=83619 RepID=A0A7V8GKD5_9GAMM|nr:hypothetical protein [Pseudoxanthomonas broegbernensis]KAF1684969.1 hypothetical protein B1992_13700 [Pseudoxanthomonas broegbernensis]MBB6064845.1 hypothetical protein [Pseudoxanthomonas broegbernensis]